MNRLKINAPDLDRLRTLVLVVCAPYGGIDATFRIRGERYNTGSRPLSSINAMVRWDIFHAACKIDRALLQHLYDYLNDNHIESALKYITDTK